MTYDSLHNIICHMTWNEQRQVLKAMGYNNYREYIAGVVWADIRDRVFKEKGNKCVVCTRRATVIHHKEYSKEVLEGKNITPLILLCWDCHNTIEYDKNGQKIPLDYANNKLEWYLKNKHMWNRTGRSQVSVGVIKERRYTTSDYLYSQNSYN